MAARPTTQDGRMGRQRGLWLSDGVVDSGSVAMNGAVDVVAIHTFVIVRFAYFAGEAKIDDSTDPHFIHKDVFKLDVSMNVSGDLVQVSYTSDDLAKHHASVIMR